MISSKSKAAAFVFCTLGVAAVVLMYANNMGTTSTTEMDDGNLKHGRMALRMDALHRVVGHRASSQQHLTALVRGACPKGKPGVQVSGIKLNKIAKEDGALFWASKADPYVLLKLNGKTQKTKVHKDKESAKFDGIFCFEGKAAVDALNDKGLVATAMDSDKGEFLGALKDNVQLAACCWQVISLECSPAARFSHMLVPPLSTTSTFRHCRDLYGQPVVTTNLVVLRSRRPRPKQPAKTPTSAKSLSPSQL